MDRSCTPPRQSERLPVVPAAFSCMNATVAADKEVSSFNASTGADVHPRRLSPLPPESCPSSSSIVLLSFSGQEEEASDGRHYTKPPVDHSCTLPNASASHAVGETGNTAKTMLSAAAPAPRLTQERLEVLRSVAVDEPSLARRVHTGEELDGGSERGTVSAHRGFHRHDRLLDWLSTAISATTSPACLPSSGKVEQGELDMAAARCPGGSYTYTSSPSHTPPRLTAPPEDPPSTVSSITNRADAATREQLWCAFEAVTPVRKTLPFVGPCDHGDANCHSSAPSISRADRHHGHRHHGDVYASAHTAPVRRRHAQCTPPVVPSPAQRSAGTTPPRVAPLVVASSPPVRPPCVCLGRPSQLASFITSPSTAVESHHRMCRRQNIKVTAGKSVAAQMMPSAGGCTLLAGKSGSGGNNRGGDQKSSPPPTSCCASTDGAAHHVTLRICTLSGFTLRVAVDRRLPVSLLADRVAQYIHAHREHVQLKYAKTGAVFDAAAADDGFSTARASSTAALRLCDLPNLAEADVFIVLLRSQAATLTGLSSSASPPLLHQSSPSASRRAAKRRLTDDSSHAMPIRKSGPAAAVAQSSSPHHSRRRMSSPPSCDSDPQPCHHRHQGSKGSTCIVNRVSLSPQSTPSRPSASVAGLGSSRSNAAGGGGVGVQSSLSLGGSKAAANRGGRELLGSYCFPPLAGASPSPR
ncbi:hypothetical protein ABL78_8173 [Leptomonas seymouri]|uniref:Uncharacterized protein n=1 Tax=Leptomonas seymouri TaxID=5684 RepID=A0A0N1IHA9_LEPSE|nr:hypothetical protein ABL78_8173 [Leptomonas seymouri]|eukprot:KPI82813.1 hypothetical protein ABL78_8173 [Leptomonas seymouri]